MNLFRRFTGHLGTVARHRHKVLIHCARAGILWQGLRHDLSKFSPSEFIPGVKYYQGTRSPNEGEREDKGYSLAWMHHKGRNKHHFEYWSDFNVKSFRNEPVEMPYRYVAEMFCDRLAASKTYNGKKYKQTDPLAYFEKRKPQRSIHQKTSEEIEKLLRMNATKGEKRDVYLYKRTIEKGKEQK